MQFGKGISWKQGTPHFICWYFPVFYSLLFLCLLCQLVLGEMGYFVEYQDVEGQRSHWVDATQSTPVTVEQGCFWGALTCWASSVCQWVMITSNPSVTEDFSQEVPWEWANGPLRSKDNCWHCRVFCFVKPIGLPKYLLAPVTASVRYTILGSKNIEWPETQYNSY